MKAILHTRYEPPDLLELKEVATPAPRDNEVLIAVHATTVSTGDCNVRIFTFVTTSMLPIAKVMFGIGKPWKARVLGTELAGEVEGAGKDVKRFKTGDRSSTEAIPWSRSRTRSRMSSKGTRREMS